TLKVGAKAKQGEQGWQIERAIMSRSARILMEGWVRVPANYAALSESKE
ncbi:2-methylaconitate cis-trans isomerase PrpF family protein, partial [Vibrio mimicus]